MDIETTVADNEEEQQSDSGITNMEGSMGSNRSSFSSLSEDMTEDMRMTDEDADGKELDVQLDHALESSVEIAIDRNEEGKDAVSMNLERTATINDALNQASLLGDFNSDYFDLSLDGKPLPRTITLRDAAIPHGSRLRLVEREFQIFIRRVDGRTTTMDVRSSNTIQQLKERFDFTDHVPVHQQRLLFQDAELENSRTLQSYNIRSQSTLQSVYRLRGGA
jgi:5S rRNA maturation endonuclease (ribonuclease M5)